MASEGRIYNLPLACHTLLEPELICQEGLQERLDEIASEFIWLNEIVDEAYKLFAVKSCGLKQMPQTPSVKQRGQERNRQKVEAAIKKETAHGSNSIPRTSVHKQLQFKREPLNSVAKVVKRPVVNFQKTSKEAITENNRPSKRITQQSRNQFSDNLSSKFKKSEKCRPSGQDECKENKQPVREIPNKIAAREHRIGSSEDSNKKTFFPSASNKKSEEKSKIVSEPVSTCKVVSKHGTSKSSLKPENTNNMSHVTSKFDVSRQDCNSSKLVSSKGSSGDTVSHKLKSIEPNSTKSLQQIAKHTNRITSNAKTSKQMTRLGLKEEIQHKKDVEKSKTIQKSTIESSILLSGLDTRSPLSVFSEKNKDPCKGTADKSMFDDIENTQCQSDALDETVTMVTEVFEIIGKDQTVRLKEFEIIKTKTVPISDIIKHEANLVPTDSRLNHQYSSSDQGFNDDFDEATNESSDEEVIDGMNSIGDNFGNGFNTEDEIDVSARTRASTKKTNEVTITTKAAKQNKDSGFNSGRVKPVSFATLTKYGITSEHNDRASHTRTRAQKESSSKDMYVEDTVRPLETSMRPKKVVDICQNRSISKRLAEEKGLSPRPKRSCNDHEKSTNNRPFQVNSINKKAPGLLNKTSGCGLKIGKLISSVTNTPTRSPGSVIISFLNRNTPPSQQSIQFHKEQKLLENENLRNERFIKAAELRKQKIEDMKRLKEEKAQKVAEARQIRLRCEQEQKEKLSKKLEFKAMLKEKLMEERCKKESEKHKQRWSKKQVDTSMQRNDEEDRMKNLIEHEEETKVQKQSKNDIEEAEQKRHISEEGKKLEERLAENEQKRKEEKLRLKQAEEEKERIREDLRIKKEKQIAFEIAERERIEREKWEEKNRKILEGQEKLKSMERQRLQRQQERLQQQQELQQTKVVMIDNKHSNSPFKKSPALTITNTTQTLDVRNSKTTSYEITPAKKQIVSSTGSNPDNYNIDDKGSDDSTDTEEDPKKKIPEWASGVNLKIALVRQHMHPPDLELIFRISTIESPDLVLLFPNRRRPRYRIRTSSAIWNSPPLPQHQ